MDRKKRPVSGSEGFRLNEVKNREREDYGLMRVRFKGVPLFKILSY